MSDSQTSTPDVLEGLRIVRRHLTLTLFLDLLIATYALVLAVLLITGGLDLGVIRLTGAAKPILVLLVAVPLRLTLDQPSHLLQRVRSRLPSSKALFSLIPCRIPPDIADVAFAMVVTSVSTFAVGFVANLLLSTSRVRPFEMPFDNVKFVETFAAWDSGWYFDIARRGYYFEPNSPSSIAFFPLYPMLIRLVAWPFGSTDQALWIAGIVVSCLSFALALLTLHRLTQRICGDRDTARRTVLYLAIFPFSFFFTRVYAESVLLLTSVLAISRAYDGRWARAGLWGALATLSRPNGILIGLPLLLLALRDWPSPACAIRRLIALLFIPIAFLGYCTFVYTLAGHPLAWLSAQANWGYSLGHPPWQQLLKMLERIVHHGIYDYFFVSNMAPFRLFHGVAALIFVSLIPVAFKRFGLALGMYVLISLLVPLSGSALEGVGRYAAVLFPAFMALATVTSPRAHEAILITSCVFLALFVCLFVTHRPIY